MNKVLICWFCLVLGFGLSACQKEEWLFSLSDLDDSVMYEVNIRNYTEAGTFQAFMEHLPKLQALGVDVLWLMPIHPISETKRNGTLGSFYSISDYDEVNPEFGSKDDFYELMQKAHELGFTVLMDLVVNH
ncbi:MAG: alpha-amylase family glycosyl hydrolase, partial [Bacilli bacterium]